MAANTIWYANFGNGSSTGYYAVTAWAAGATIAAGVLRRQSAAPTVGNERVFVAIVAGTTAGSEPTWTVTKGAKNTDNTVTWQECTGQPAVNGDATNTPAWTSGTAFSLGNIIKNTAATAYFICSTAGTTAGSEPTWNTTAGNTNADNTATWTCIGAVGAFTTAWGAPCARLVNAQNWAANGDTIYVSGAHAETQSTAITWTNSGNAANAPLSIICVANGGNIPPQSGDVTTGASVTTTGASNMSLTGNLDINGVSFTCGSGGTSGTLSCNGGGNGCVRFRNCALNLLATVVATLSINSASDGRTELINTTVGVNNVAKIALFSQVVWRDTPAALSTANTWPAQLINSDTNLKPGTSLFEGVDFSGFGGTNLFYGGSNGQSPQRIVLSRCKLPSGNITSAITSSAYPQIDVIACDTGGNAYRHERWAAEATQTTELVAVRTSGASDGTTNYAWKIVTSSTAALVRWATPFESMPIVVWNATTGANVTVTFEAAYNGTALPNNDELWMEAVYFGTASSTRGSRATQTKANALTTATALTASTVAWDGAASARANTTAYVVGNFIKLASNTGRLFVCTVSGTSSGSEPGGYASAVDGGSVTDGGATFRALVRCKLTVTLSSPQPQAAGYLHCYVKAAKVSSTFYVDPKATLS